MSNRIRLAAAALLSAVVVSLLTVSPAHAGDQRPCVSKAEFYGSRDFGIVIPKGHDWMAKTPPPEGEPIGRPALEDRWDVRRLGTTVKHTVDGSTLGAARLVRVKMYESCEFPLSELQVYVGFHKDTDLVLWTMWWPTRS